MSGSAIAAYLDLKRHRDRVLAEDVLHRLAAAGACRHNVRSVDTVAGVDPHRLAERARRARSQALAEREPEEEAEREPARRAYPVGRVTISDPNRAPEREFHPATQPGRRPTAHRAPSEKP